MKCLTCGKNRDNSRFKYYCSFPCWDKAMKDSVDRFFVQPKVQEQISELADKIIKKGS